jgi:cyclophilin family peptidyl-prolyl cis-trans isomerase
VVSFQTERILTVTKVRLETSKGNIVLELDEAKAPVTVANFLKYVDEGFYDGTIFHRVIASFMVQGGGFDKDMKQKKTHAEIVNESSNGLENKRGAIAMARTSAPNSASSQFFINIVDNAFLNKAQAQDRVGYCVFGSVVEGIETLDLIKVVKTGNVKGHGDVPLEPVLLNKAVRV